MRLQHVFRVASAVLIIGSLLGISPARASAQGYGGLGAGPYGAGYQSRGYSYGWGIAPYGRDDFYRGYYFPPLVPLTTAASPDTRARIRLHLPADAEVWFEGHKTSQKGAVRDFYSPPLEPGKRFSYQVRARWTEDGRPVERERTVRVHADSRAEVDLTAPAASAPSTKR
jgi:uncharacterized protein (TIGR03000 family)